MHLLPLIRNYLVSAERATHKKHKEETAQQYKEVEDNEVEIVAEDEEVPEEPRGQGQGKPQLEGQGYSDSSARQSNLRKEELWWLFPVRYIFLYSL